jgi:hypothetical protein
MITRYDITKKNIGSACEFYLAMEVTRKRTKAIGGRNIQLGLVTFIRKNISQLQC